MQAIVTKYLGPTNFKGSRVKATCQADSITIGWDDALDADGNHEKAARALLHKLGWDTEEYLRHGDGRMSVGAMPDGRGNVYVLTPFPADQILINSPK